MFQGLGIYLGFETYLAEEALRKLRSHIVIPGLYALARATPSGGKVNNDEAITRRSQNLVKLRPCFNLNNLSSATPQRIIPPSGSTPWIGGGCRACLFRGGTGSLVGHHDLVLGFGFWV